MFLAQQMPTFASVVGVAPSTTTMVLPEARPVPRRSRNYYVPYTTIEDLRSGGLGVINETDAWLTGRPYGLPGTASIRFTRRADGRRLASEMVGGFGDADTAAVALQLQLIAQAQAAQQASLKRIAFWQMLLGGISVGALAAGVIYGVVRHVHGDR